MIPFALKASVTGLAAAIAACIALINSDADAGAENSTPEQSDNYQVIAPLKQVPESAPAQKQKQTQALSAPVMPVMETPVEEDFAPDTITRSASVTSEADRPVLAEEITTASQKSVPASESTVIPPEPEPAVSSDPEQPVSPASEDSTVPPATQHTEAPPLSAVPPGFESLAAAQTTMADVFYGGRPIGMMQVTYTPDTVTISNPADIVRRIPDIKNPEEVEAALTGEISSNASELCVTARDTRCGVITPEVAGVTYNAGQFRLDVFVAEEYLRTRSVQQDKFLPESTSSLGMINGLRATASGTSGLVNDSNSYTLFGNSLVGWRENHLVSDWDYSDDHGFSVETLYAQRDANGYAVWCRFS